MSFIEVFAIIMSRYTSEDYIPANGAYVGLAPPGDVGSWQRECKVIFLTSILISVWATTQADDIFFLWLQKFSFLFFLSFF